MIFLVQIESFAAVCLNMLNIESVVFLGYSFILGLCP